MPFWLLMDITRDPGSIILPMDIEFICQSTKMLGIMFTVLIHFWFHAEHYTPTAGRKSKFWSLVWTWLFGGYHLFCQIMLAINDTSLDTLDTFCNDLPWSFLLNTNHCTQAHQKFNLQILFVNYITFLNIMNKAD